jgi:putative ABC transport system ATP-binding protein
MSDKTPALEVRDLTKTYPGPHGGPGLTVLKGVSFDLTQGDSLAIVGPSGSGKTTLLGLCAGLDRATAGSVTLAGIRLDDLSEDERARVRNDHTGFVFQNFQLVPTLTAIENVMVPAELRPPPPGQSRRAVLKERGQIAAELLGAVGLGDRFDHFPTQLSGGEQQRVALARAFVNRPRILFADEPTGNLDAETSELVLNVLFELNRSANTALVLVTHNLELAARVNRILRMKNGAVVD